MYMQYTFFTRSVRPRNSRCFTLFQWGDSMKYAIFSLYEIHCIQYLCNTLYLGSMQYTFFIRSVRHRNPRCFAPCHWMYPWNALYLVSMRYTVFSVYAIHYVYCLCNTLSLFGVYVIETLVASRLSIEVKQPSLQNTFYLVSMKYTVFLPIDVCCVCMCACACVNTSGSTYFFESVKRNVHMSK